jgi:hypothetical protein
VGGIDPDNKQQKKSKSKRNGDRDKTKVEAGKVNDDTIQGDRQSAEQRQDERIETTTTTTTHDITTSLQEAKRKDKSK